MSFIKCFMKKKLFYIFILCIAQTHLSASQNESRRDAIRSSLYKRESFVQGELRQMAGCGLLLSPFVTSWGIVACLKKTPAMIKGQALHGISPSKKTGPLLLATGVALALPAITIMYRIERQIDQEMKN